jgi:phospholipase C
MSFLQRVVLCSSISVCLLLAGCGSGSKTSTVTGNNSPPPPTSFQVTVTAPPANAGVITSAPAGIECSGNGGDTSNVCMATFATGTQVTLTATAAPGYSFNGWSGACSGVSNCVVTVTTAMTVTPTFVASSTATLTVGYLPMGVPSTAGTVTSNPTGIACPGTCSASFASNTSVVLNATAATGYAFAGWSGGGCSGTSSCSVNVTSAETVSATFTSTATTATLTASVAGTGTVTSSPAGISCPGTCSATFPLNSSVTLTETAGTGNGFTGWGGACSGTGNCSVLITAAETVSANFAPNSGSLKSLNHIIIFAQENRSLDHYFGAMRQYWANKGIPDQSFDGLPQFNPTSGNNLPLYGPPPAVPGCDPSLSSSTNCQASAAAPLVTSFHNTYTVCSEALSPFWNEAHIDWDYNDPTGTAPAKLDGWVQAAANDARQVTPQLHDVNGYRSMGYYDDSDLNYYYFMASTFATSDRYFAPIMSRTQLNRMFLLAATSGGHVYPLGPPYGALTNPPIFEALQNAGVTWKIYVNSTGTGCSDSASACLIKHSYLNMFTYFNTVNGSPLLQNIVSVTQLMTDMANGTLPQVALIEPPSDAGLDEHPTDTDSQGGIDIQAGAAFTAGIMNGLMASPNWKDSAMFFTYDEPGGFYDHVSPQPATPPDAQGSSTYLPIDLQAGDICSGSELGSTAICSFASTGYRLPFIVVSPFAKKNYVSHTVYDHTAILKLIEERFGLSPLSLRDAAQNDMSTDFFDFVNVPWATPPTAVPTQKRSYNCNLNALPAPPPNP